MCTTTSRLICKSCPIPCSTLNVCVVSPVHHRPSSVDPSHMLASTSTIVQMPPEWLCSVYEGLVLGNASNAFTALNAPLSPKLSSSMPESPKPLLPFMAASRCCKRESREAVRRSYHATQYFLCRTCAIGGALRGVGSKESGWYMAIIRSGWIYEPWCLRLWRLPRTCKATCH